MTERLGMFRGTVTRVTGGATYVRVPTLAGDATEFGPCDVAAGYGGTTGTTAVGDHGSHGHTSPYIALVAGDRVVVGFIEGRAEFPVVLARLA